MSIARSLNYMNQHNLLAAPIGPHSTREELAWHGVSFTETETDMTLAIPTRVLYSHYHGEAAARDLVRYIAKLFDFHVTGAITQTVYPDFVRLHQAKSELPGYVARDTKVVGLIGRRRSGKDTAAFALMQAGYTGLKFAGALKAMLDTYLEYVGVSPDVRAFLIEGAQKELPLAHLQGKSTRFAMQTLGTEWGRDLIGENLWVDAAIARAKQFEKVVFTDVRFPNEVAALQGIGATIIKIERPDNDCSGEVDAHVSEAAVDKLPYNFKIVNDSTVQKLHDAIKAVVNLN